MTEEIIIAGFGGQGVLSMGMILCYSGMIEEKEVSWMPSYGPEMRGGTANCIAIVSDSKISSPIISKFDTVIALNQPSVDKFEKAVKPGGLLLYEANNVIHPPTRSDIEIIGIDATKEAAKMKNTKIMNMIMLGGFLKKKPIIELNNILEGLKKVLPERYHNLLPLNEQALKRGMEMVEEASVIS
ncbi:MAG: 2-oxoacid:acceptor oxidoreductase family protein [Ignavibacteriae bacterium]|nr:2-oxoacid:acceptor oxidoreductase family protein [Ignavibacteriota bacterium]MCB9206675.1 2-oxoacid:acceptor oxidoreductase family protein [Ignavibacteriales bacterium]MCB9210610.1 2-oxoacid:acceptor oxidoreductase family protein [Ignavibacteriales bacterium]MCB9218788.1 2-oxoacid:acceptor oxidoreductase family protein [Ignavibacteriales bacterium]MCB9259208.1 2-oxoacid:acceptor oxidoreductase family protein [Ignavibacteriales bacterium]